MNIWKITDLTLVFGVANEKKTSWLKDHGLWKITKNSMEKITAYLLFLFHELQSMENHPSHFFRDHPAGCRSGQSATNTLEKMLNITEDHGDDCLGMVDVFCCCFLGLKT
jgi:hypothetical protein